MFTGALLVINIDLILPLSISAVLVVASAIVAPSLCTEGPTGRSASFAPSASTGRASRSLPSIASVCRVAGEACRLSTWVSANHYRLTIGGIDRQAPASDPVCARAEVSASTRRLIAGLLA
jgi:hypothetical protein